MKVYRIKHKPSGLYVKFFGLPLEHDHKGLIFNDDNLAYLFFIDNPDYEILYNELKN